MSTYIADATNRSRATELKPYQPETFGEEHNEQEATNRTFTNRHRDRPVSFAPDTFEPDVVKAPEYSEIEEERSYIASQTSYS